MGFFRTVGKVTGFVFNFKVATWLNYDHLKDTTIYLCKLYITLFRIPTETNAKETFNEASDRLSWTEDLLKTQAQHFLTISCLFLFSFCCIFCYGIYLFQAMHNLMGAMMSWGISCFALSQSFRYHFWRYQIKKQKLNCSIREWAQDTFYKGFFK